VTPAKCRGKFSLAAALGMVRSGVIGAAPVK
jgi:hypothetical protein